MFVRRYIGWHHIPSYFDRLRDNRGASSLLYVRAEEKARASRGRGDFRAVQPYVDRFGATVSAHSGHRSDFCFGKRTLCYRRKFLNRAGMPSSQPTSPAYGMALWTRGFAPEMDY